MKKTISLPIYNEDFIEIGNLQFTLARNNNNFEINILEPMEGLSDKYIEVDYFYALSQLREDLERMNKLLGCKGCLDHVFPSGMLADMSDGLLAYDYSSEEKISDGCRVKVFDRVEPVETRRLVTFKQQKANRDELISSGKLQKRGRR